MNILIIGGAGYIGGVTAHLAHNKGHRVTVLDDLSTGNDYNVPAGVELERIDVRDRDAVEAFFTGASFDAVMHFAARILVPESMTQPYDYFAVNSFGLLNTADAAVRAGIKNYILSSTAAVYGHAEKPVSETDPTRPISPYGISKLIAEQILAGYALSHQLNWVALRYFNVAGAYEGVGTDYPFVSHVIPSLLKQMHQKEPVYINGNDYDTSDGTAVRDYTHVLDIASAHLLAAKKMIEGTSLRQPINLASRRGFSVKEVAETFNQVTGAELPIKYRDRRAGDPARLVADNRLAKKLLGWEPQHDLKKIISDHYEWFVRQSRRQ